MFSSQLPFVKNRSRDFRGAFVGCRTAHRDQPSMAGFQSLCSAATGKCWPTPQISNTQAACPMHLVVQIFIRSTDVAWAQVYLRGHGRCHLDQYSSSESETSSPRSRRASLSFLAFFFSLLFSVFFCCFTLTMLPVTRTTACQLKTIACRLPLERTAAAHISTKPMVTPEVFQGKNTTCRIPKDRCYEAGGAHQRHRWSPPQASTPA